MTSVRAFIFFTNSSYGKQFISRKKILSIFFDGSNKITAQLETDLFSKTIRTRTLEYILNGSRAIKRRENKEAWF